MKKHLLFLLPIVTLLYMIWLAGLDAYYYRFVALSFEPVKWFIPKLMIYLLESGSSYHLQITIKLTYHSTQPLNILCLPVVLLLAWQIYLFIRIPLKRALVVLLINYSIFHLVLMADLLAAPFMETSEIARYFYSFITTNLSILVIILIIKDAYALKKRKAKVMI